MVHGDRYDYSDTEYMGAHAKVIITCRTHGSFSQQASEHLRGRGCRRCGAKALRGNKEFVAKALEVHGDRYDYSTVDYRRSTIKVVITCREHGPFSQEPRHHLSGSGCPNCSSQAGWTQERFEVAAEAVHGDRYDYSNAIYKTALIKIPVKCREHGPFYVTPAHHVRGIGCPDCPTQAAKKHDVFIAEATEVHEGRYDYSMVQYKTSRLKVTIICRQHGPFPQKPSNHLAGQGCPRCPSSKGEQAVRSVLQRYGVDHVEQWTHPTLRLRGALRVDFCIPGRRVLIEFDGAFHRKPVRWRGRSQEEANRLFADIQRRDAFKNVWAEVNGYCLIRLIDLEDVERDLLRAGVVAPSMLDTLAERVEKDGSSLIDLLPRTNSKLPKRVLPHVPSSEAQQTLW